MERRIEYTTTASAPDYKPFLLRMPAALHQRVKLTAVAGRQTMTQIMTIAIEKYLDGQKTKGDQTE